MREGSRSQAFLSLFTTPERAASIVGDLLEESRAQGRVRYTWRTIGVALALCLRSVRSAPLRCLMLAALGSAVYGCVLALVFVAVGLPWYPWQHVGEPSWWFRLAVVGSLANLLTGFILGRWVSIRGINALAPLALIWLVAWPLELVLWKLLFLRMPLALFAALALAYPLLGLLPLMTGGTLARWRRGGRAAATTL